MSIDLTVEAFLNQKFGLSNNMHTKKMYASTINGFRKLLKTNNIDLLPENGVTVSERQKFSNSLAQVAVQFIEDASSIRTKLHRKSVLNGYYTSPLVINYRISNPVGKMAKLRKNKEYSLKKLAQALSAFNLTSEVDLRDFALILVHFDLGQTASYLSKMTTADLLFKEERYYVKHNGGEFELHLNVSKALEMWLNKVYNGDLSGNKPLWLSFAPPKIKKSLSLTSQGIRLMFKTHLDESVPFIEHRKFIRIMDAMSF